MKNLTISGLTCALLMSTIPAGAQSLTDVKQWLDDRFADKTLGASFRECLEAGEQYRRLYMKEVDNLLGQYGGADRRQFDYDKTQRLSEYAEQAARDWVKQCQGAVLDGAKKSYGLPIKYGRKRLRNVNEQGEQIDQSIDNAEKRVEQGKTLYNAGKRAMEFANPSKKPSRDAQTDRVPIYDFRAGNGIAEVWLVGYQTANGNAMLDTPRLIQRSPVGSARAPAPTSNARPRPTPSPQPTPREGGYSTGERRGLPQ